MANLSGFCSYLVIVPDAAPPVIVPDVIEPEAAAPLDEIVFFNSLPGLNLGTLFAGISIDSPVNGFLPFLPALLVTENVPKPDSVTLSSLKSDSVTFDKKQSNILSAAAFEISPASAIATIKSLLFIFPPLNLVWSKQYAVGTFFTAYCLLPTAYSFFITHTSFVLYLICSISSRCSSYLLSLLPLGNRSYLQVLARLRAGD